MASIREKINVYESLLHRIQMYREVTLDRERLFSLLDKICNWSYAHRRGNGELSDTEHRQIINKAFDKLKEIE